MVDQPRFGYGVWQNYIELAIAAIMLAYFVYVGINSDWPLRYKLADSFPIIWVATMLFVLSFGSPGAMLWMTVIMFLTLLLVTVLLFRKMEYRAERFAWLLLLLVSFTMVLHEMTFYWPMAALMFSIVRWMFKAFNVLCLVFLGAALAIFMPQAREFRREIKAAKTEHATDAADDEAAAAADPVPTTTTATT